MRNLQRNGSRLLPPLLWLLSLLAGATALRAELDARLQLAYEADALALPGGGAVRALATGDDGALYAGGSQLAVLERRTWETIATDGVRDFTALATNDRRVYYAAVNGLGYVEATENAVWAHRSLVPALAEAGVGASPRISSIHILDTGVVFVSPDALLHWNGARFTVWPVDLPPGSRGWIIDGAVHVFQPGAGLLRLGPGGPVPLWTEAALPGGRLQWLAALGETAGRPAKRWLAGTDAGVFHDDGRGWRRLPSASAALAHARTTDVLALDERTVTVATRNRGAFLIGDDDEVTALSAPDINLPDTTINAVRLGADLHLWLATDRGLARTASPALYTLLDGRDVLGGSTLVAVTGGDPARRIVTRRAVLPLPAGKANDPGAPLPPAPQRDAFHGRVDGMAEWSGRIWVRSHRELWRETRPDLNFPWEQGGRIDLELVHTWPRELTALLSLRHGGGLLAAVGTSLWMIEERSGAALSIRDLGIELEVPPTSWMEDENGGLWVTGPGGEIIRHIWSRDDTGTMSLPASARMRAEVPVRLTRVGRRLFVFGGTEILEATQSGLVAPSDLKGYTLVAAAADPDRADAAYWLLRPTVLGASASPALFRLVAGDRLELEPRRTPDLGFLGDIVSFSSTPALAAERATTPGLWIGGQRGAIRLGPAHLAPPSSPQAPQIDLIETTDRSGQSRRLNRHPAEALRLDTELESVAFHFRRPLAPDPGPYLQTRLRDVESAWSPPSRAGHRSFTGLAEGEYRLEARTVDAHGRIGPVREVAFVVVRPWWRNTGLLAVAVAAACALAAALVQWRLRRLRRLNEQLDRLVLERTRALELSNSAKSVFLENISHEIRNPLHGIVGLIGMLDDERLPPSERDLTRSLRACASHLHRVSEEVLAFSQLEYAQESVASEPFQLEALVRIVVNQHASLADRHGSSIRLALPSKWLDGFVGDEPKLATIVSNFVVNALKYAPGEPVVVSVEIADPDLAESHGLLPPDLPCGRHWELVTIEVRDYGPGIPPEEQELIFQKFVRGSKAQESGVPGTGLGLAACQVLARRLGARIGVHSAPGEGATFYVQVPLRRASVPAEADACLDKAPTDLPTTGGCVLVVDDEDYNRVVLVGMLQSLGHAADEAGDIEGARRQLRERAYTIVFLDWELAGGTGGDLAREIRLADGDGAPLLIATTAHDGPASRRRCEEAGMDEFLLKPYDRGQVQAAIERARDRRRRSTNSPATTDALRYYAAARPDRAERAAEDLREAIDALYSAISTAAGQGDRFALAAAAHRLAGLAGTVGADTLNAAARQVCEIAQTSSSRWEESLVRLRAAAEAFTASLAAHRASGMLHR